MTATDSSPTSIYDVPGISCDHCKHAIEGEVSRLSSVERVTVEVDARKVEVVGDVDEADVRLAIDAAGYDVAAVTRVR